MPNRTPFDRTGTKPTCEDFEDTHHEADEFTSEEKHEMLEWLWKRYQHRQELAMTIASDVLQRLPQGPTSAAKKTIVQVDVSGC
jgi:hypothetical protein